MATSTVPTLKANLQARLQARVGLAGVQVSYGAPFPMPEPEWIWLADVEGEQEPAALGRQRRSETFRLEVLVRVVRSTLDDQEAATERAYALAAELENELRSDPTVGVAADFIAQIGGPFRLAEDANAEQRVASLVVTVTCRARI
ncbi:MAG: hypothetical protein R3C15_15485 [Thermoleophilia bacterium]